MKLRKHCHSFVVQFKPFTVLFLLLSICHSVSGQTSKPVDTLAFLIDKVSQTKGSNKLLWLDSLSAWQYKQKSPEYPATANEVIEYAIALDSIRYAIDNTIDFLDFLGYTSGEFKKAQEVFLSVAPRIQNEKDPAKLGWFYWEGAGVFMLGFNYKEALHQLKIAEKYAKKSKETYLLARVKYFMGTCYSRMGDFENGVASLQEAIKLYGEEHPFNAAYAITDLAILHSQNGLHNEAKKIRMGVIQEIRENPNILPKDSLRIYNTIYSVFFEQAFNELLLGNQKERLRYLDSAKTYSKYLTNDYDRLEWLLTQLGAYSENGQLERAIAIKKELDRADIEQKAKNMGGYNLSMAHYEFAVGNIDKAIGLAKEELNFLKEIQYYEGQVLANKFLSNTYDFIGKKEQAYSFLVAHNKLKDSIETVQKASSFSYYQTLLETEKKEAKIAIQNSEIQVLDAENKAKTQWIIIGGIIAVALLIIIFLAYYARYNRKRKTLQTEFAQNLIKERENQYAHIARELHDSVGQKLMLLVKKTNEDKKEEMLNSLAKDSLDEIRSISHGLHPANLRHTGISSSITTMINKIDESTTIFFTHQIENIDGLLTEEEELHLYRILQESLSNLVKHSEAKAAAINIERQKHEIKATISDNGKGFSLQKSINKGSLGMKTLLERAEIIGSKLQITTQENQGTKIQLLIPLGI